MLASRDYLMSATRQDQIALSSASREIREEAAKKRDEMLKWANHSALVEIAEALARITKNPIVGS